MSTQRTGNPQESHPRQGPGRPSRAPRRVAFGVEALEPRALLDGSGLPDPSWPIRLDASSVRLPAPMVVSPADLKARVTLPGAIDVQVSAPFRPRGSTNLFKIAVDEATTEIDMRLRPGADAKPYTAEVFLLDEEGRELAGWLLTSESGVVALGFGPGSEFDGTSLTIGVARPHLPGMGRPAAFSLEVLRILAPMPQDPDSATTPSEGDGVGWNNDPASPAGSWPDRGSNYAYMVVPDLSTAPNSTEAGPLGGGSSDGGSAGEGVGTLPAPPQPPPTPPAIPPTPLPPNPSQPFAQSPPWSPSKPESPAPPLVIEKDRPLAIDLVDLDRLPDHAINELAPGGAVDPEVEIDGEMLASWRGPDDTLMLGAAPAGDRPSPLIATEAAGFLDWRPAAKLSLGRAVGVGARLRSIPAIRGQDEGLDSACSESSDLPLAREVVATNGGSEPGTAESGAVTAKRARGLRWSTAIAPFLVGLSFSTVLFASLLLPDIDAAVEAERAARRRERRRS